ncbi:hypothetical protein IRT45_30910 [Nocardia sp. BSTN01]|nr:hypothetical protein [Nocardia sp. BSTN01]MBF5001543.1 hypothetical protein [Nocardia sp. BSTN01]
MGNLPELAMANSERLPEGASPALRAALERRLNQTERPGGFNSFIGSGK